MADLYLKNMGASAVAHVQENIEEAEQLLYDATNNFDMRGWAPFTGVDGKHFLIRATEVNMIADA